MNTKTFTIGSFFRWLFLILMAAFAVIPLLQVFLNSFRTDMAVKSNPIGLPDTLVFNNYPETWKIGGYATAYINSIFIASVVIILVIVLVGLCGYALSKMHFAGREFIIGYFFVALSLPSFLYIVPDYYVMNKLGLTNSYIGIILLYTAIELPFNMLLLRTFLMSIPRELEEAGKIDGCSELMVLIRITIPIAKPIFLTIALLTFVRVWNEFLWANTFLVADNLKTVATRYVRFVGEFSSNMVRIYTASVITVAPVILLYLIFSRRFIEGMTSGSVKG